ncbi:Gfo/Idh/MocA family protein [Falsirhodobacter xinxiangensis]|uniref:Gfo/Idh/MocA family protein n=1 Tax=Falsirhodobacter xinxiangensis TaxID=2530049 RepID=UPI0010A9EB38|nr:Gfo/Idh/MocA family oxidoreductase [Rhodobacter xinxiangensis]
MKNKLKIGVLGCGHISGDHLLAWQRYADAEVVALCDPQIERARSKAVEFGIAQTFDDPSKMFEQGGLDAVDIITPRQTHAAMIRLAADHGLAALCEKPLCPTHAEAMDLLRSVGDRVRVMVNENWRYRAYFLKIHEWLKTGRLGTVTQARIALWRSNMLPDSDGSIPALRRQPFVAKEERLLIAESLIHELDTMRALFGEMNVVAARLGRNSDRILGEDAAMIMLEADAGHNVIVEGVMTAAGYPFRAPNRLEIAGTRCSVVLDGAVLRLMGAEHEEHVFDEDEVRQGCFDRAIAHFADSLRDGTPFWTSAADQARTLRLVEDAYIMAGAPRRPGIAA